MPRSLPKVLSLCLALAVLLPLLLIAPSISRADGPTTNWLAAVDPALALDANATEADRAERVNVSLVMAGAPVVDTYIALKNTAGKTDIAAAQKARAAELTKAQDAVLKALPQSKASSLRVLGQHQLLSNSISVRVNRGEIEALRQLPGVVRITPLPNAQLDLANSVPHIGATRVATELGITGRGMRIAVIDTGIDYTHRNYGGPGTMAAYMAAVTDLKHVTETVTLTNPTTGETVTTKMFPTAKIPGGYDLVGDNWPNTTDEVTEPDDDPIDAAHAPYTGGHGSHTSGISAGFGVPNASFNGSIPADSTFGGTTIYHGVAPAAQILAYKVCSSVSTSCEGNAMIAGFERAADPNQDGDMSDHVDAINMSIGGPFGASESVEAANNAARAGIAVAISAGNSANFPYITGAPATADRVVSVANTFATGNFAQVGVVDAPASVAGRRFIMLEQAWAPSLASVGGSISGELVYIGRACPGDTLEGNPSGKIALIIRGTCAVSLKGEVAANAGARAAVVYNNISGDSPPSFAFGGGVQTIPVLTITLTNGQLLRSASGVQVTLSTANALDITDYINGGSSRGPSIAGSGLKPDISAPGSNILSTGAATGDQPANLSGTSMAAPHVAGVFALVKQAHPTWSAQEVMAATVNTANPIIRELLPDVTSRVIPLSWQGAGLVDAYRAVKTTTLAWVPDQVGSVSYGFNAVTTSKTMTRQFMLSNKGTTSRTYSLAFSPIQVPTGSSVTVSPTSVTLAAGEMRAVDVTLTIAASGLASYQLFNQNTVNPTYLDNLEISGFVRATETGGAGDAVSVPVYALARKASAVASASNTVTMPGFGADDAGTVTLTNNSPLASSAAVFAYLGTDPDEADVKNQYDVKYVGVRPVTLTSSTGNRPGLQFVATFHGAPTLALQTRLNFYIDANRDGRPDYVVFNDDVGRRAGSVNGQNAVYVQNLSTGRVTAGFFTNFAANSSVMALTVAASDIGLSDTNTAFNFYLESWAWYAPDVDEDRAPNTGSFTYNTARPRFGTSVSGGSLDVPANGSASLTLYANARAFVGGDAAGLQYEKGALLVYSDNDAATQAQVILPSFPSANFTVQEQTFTAEASRTGYVFNRLGASEGQLGTGALWTGVDNRSRTPLVYYGIAQFNLGAAGARIEFDEASLDLTGLDDSLLDPRLDSRWLVDLLGASVDANLGRATFNMIANAPVDATLTPTLTDADLGKGRPNSFSLSKAAKDALSAHIRTSGSATFRTRAEPMYSQGMHLFAWDGRTGGTAKAPTISALTITYR